MSNTMNNLDANGRWRFRGQVLSLLKNDSGVKRFGPPSAHCNFGGLFFFTQNLYY